MDLVSQAWRIVARPELELNATDQSSGKVQKRRIPTEEWNIHLVFDLEAALKWIRAFMHSINRMWSRTNCQYICISSKLYVNNIKEGEQTSNSI